jgi:hypothetical protein
MPLAKLLSTLLVLASAFALPASANAPEETGWLLEQNASSMGKHKIYLAPSAIKIVDQDTGNTLVSTAPDWTVRIFNDHSKKIFMSKGQDYSSGSNQFILIGLGVHFYNLPLIFKEKSTVKGMPVSIYVTTKLSAEHKDATNRIVRATYYVSSEIKAPKQAEKILVSFYGLPDKGGIPIELHYDNVDHEHVVWLTTTLSKASKMKATEFSYPHNYQIAKREIDLLPARPGAMQVEDILEMGAGPKH